MPNFKMSVYDGYCRSYYLFHCHKRHTIILIIMCSTNITKCSRSEISGILLLWKSTKAIGTGQMSLVLDP